MRSRRESRAAGLAAWPPRMGGNKRRRSCGRYSTERPHRLAVIETAGRGRTPGRSNSVEMQPDRRVRLARGPAAEDPPPPRVMLNCRGDMKSYYWNSLK